MLTAAVTRIVDVLLHADEHGEPLEPAAIALLLRQYVTSGREDIAAAVGRGLARGLKVLETPDLRGPACIRTAWLELFAEAAPLTEDDRLPAAALTIAARLRDEWPSRGVVATAMQSVGACLSASSVIEATYRHALIPAAVDELERIIGRVYRPGETIAHSLDRSDEDDGDLEDHVEAAAALLKAHAITDRLPYSMLAEELIQRMLRMASDDDQRRAREERREDFSSARSAVSAFNVVFGDDFIGRCGMARVLCRLAALHNDNEYRATAVLTDQSDYATEAEHILASVSPLCAQLGAAAAVYGLALDEWLRVTREMQ